MTDTIKHVTFSAQETMGIMAGIAVNCTPGMIITLSGDLGVGKTTSAQAFLSTFGIIGPYTSPTFGIIEEYEVLKGGRFFDQGLHRVYHIDAYRSDAENMLSLGWEDILRDPHAIVFVEWPEKINGILPAKKTSIVIEHADYDKREIYITTSKL